MTVGQRLNKPPDVAGGDVAFLTLDNPNIIDFTEETADLLTPDAGYRRVFARDSGALVTKDDAGNVKALAFAGGEVENLADTPKLSSYQHKAGATASVYGALRIEWGNDALSAGTKAITFQTAFKTILDIFLQGKTGANAMYPSAIGTSGFTANGTGTDNFAWLAVGVD